MEPCDVETWVWALTSGSCFHLDALQLFMNNEALGALRSCTDTYLIRGISVLMGSVLIDRSLAVYGLNGMNVFSKHPHLHCILSYARGGPSDDDQLGRKMVIDHLIANANFFLCKLRSPHHHMNALNALDDAWPRLPSPVPGCHAYLAGKIVMEARALAPALGLSKFIGLLNRLKVAPHVILKACLKHKTAKRS
ncbi:MAG: hypothetical protein ACREDM_11970 [Methylocella sp.]